MNEGNELVNGYLVEITPKWMKDALVSLGGVAKKGANFTVEKMDAGLRNALGDEQIDTLYTYVGAKRDAAGNWLYDQFTPDQLRAIIGFGAVYLGPVFAPEKAVASAATATDSLVLKSGTGAGVDIGLGAEISGSPLAGTLLDPAFDGLSYTTEIDGALFWSGKTNGIGGVELAGDFALANGGTTLEQFISVNGIESHLGMQATLYQYKPGKMLL
ncbi:MAG: hypothetical protein IPP74_07120 [Alphaproteobacteria bacterium]|nr:hypothetical protein [Alphaproteobacteria bacterium]